MPSRNAGEQAPRDRGAADALPALRPLLVLVGIVLVAAGLYAARSVFIPIALAVLLAFFLTPPVRALQRRLPRALAVTLVVVVASVVLGAAGWGVVHQLANLARELPQYTGNVRAKIAELRGPGIVLARARQMLEEISTEIERAAGGRAPAPTSVVVVGEPRSRLFRLPATVVPLLQQLVTAALVVVLVAFMLYERQQLRDQLIRLAGRGRLTLTTRVLDEAGERIMNYLLRQALVNAAFAALVALGLVLVGLPYALLWGLLAGVLRFIPYVGPWLGALAPTLLAVAVFPGWERPLLVVALFAVVEPVIGFVIEPLLYAGSAGVSRTALLIAIAFWTWLWGPIGLLLATPLTVCLVVVGKHVPGLDFLAVMMSDQPALERGMQFYQRLLAMDQDEAVEIVERHRARSSLEETCAVVLLPALAAAKRDRAEGRLAPGQAAFLLAALREILTDLEPPGPRAAEAAPVLGVPAADELDELAMLTWRLVTVPGGVDVRVASPGLLTAEVVRLVADDRPALVVVGSLPPAGLAQTRFLLKRLRAAFPELQLAVARWAEEDPGRLEALRATGVGPVSTTLAETRDQVLALARTVQPAWR